MAQHATVHFAEENHIGIEQAQSHDEPGHDEHHGKHKRCEQCLLIKSFHNILTSAPPAVVAVTFEREPILFPIRSTAQKITASAYLARAPPTFLA